VEGDAITLERRAKLEAAGHKFTTAEDLFGLDETDRQIVGFRLGIAREVRRLREERGLTQRELANRMEVAQSRIVGIEKCQGTSLDVILTAYVALGGVLPDFGIAEPAIGRRPAKRASKAAPTKRPDGMAARKASKPPIEVE